jgi:transposase
MVNNQINMAKVRQILSLHAQGVSKRKISEQTGVARNTVKKYLNIYNGEQLSWSDIEKMNNHELTNHFCPDDYRDPSVRTKTLRSLLPDIERALKRRGMTRTTQWKQYLLQHPDGYGYTSFCFYLDRWLQHSKPVMHIEHKAGDKMFIDFAGEKMHIIDKDTGEQIAVEVFAAILGCSGLTYVEAVASQTKSDLVTACENALYYYGGVPAAIVPDNLKSAVIKSSKYEPRLNETFEDFANHYSTSVLPARSYRPRDKALVEGIVKIIYTNI